MLPVQGKFQQRKVDGDTLTALQKSICALDAHFQINGIIVKTIMVMHHMHKGYVKQKHVLSYSA